MADGGDLQSPGAKGIVGDDSFSLASGARKLKELRGGQRPCGVEMKLFAKEKPKTPARSGTSIQACPRWGMWA